MVLRCRTSFNNRNYEVVSHLNDKSPSMWRRGFLQLDVKQHLPSHCNMIRGDMGNNASVSYTVHASSM